MTLSYSTLAISIDLFVIYSYSEFCAFLISLLIDVQFSLAAANPWWLLLDMSRAAPVSLRLCSVIVNCV